MSQKSGRTKSRSPLKGQQWWYWLILWLTSNDLKWPKDDTRRHLYEGVVDFIWCVYNIRLIKRKVIFRMLVALSLPDIWRTKYISHVWLGIIGLTHHPLLHFRGLDINWQWSLHIFCFSFSSLLGGLVVVYDFSSSHLSRIARNIDNIVLYIHTYVLPNTHVSKCNTGYMVFKCWMTTRCK